MPEHTVEYGTIRPRLHVPQITRLFLQAAHPQRIDCVPSALLAALPKLAGWVVQDPSNGLPEGWNETRGWRWMPHESRNACALGYGQFSTTLRPPLLGLQSPGHDPLRVAIHTSITTGQYTHVQHLADAPAAPIVPASFGFPRWQISALEFSREVSQPDACMYLVVLALLVRKA
jgi:hypothetical protein